MVIRWDLASINVFKVVWYALRLFTEKSYHPMKLIFTSTATIPRGSEKPTRDLEKARFIEYKKEPVVTANIDYYCAMLKLFVSKSWSFNWMALHYNR